MEDLLGAYTHYLKQVKGRKDISVELEVRGGTLPKVDGRTVFKSVKSQLFGEIFRILQATTNEDNIKFSSTVDLLYKSDKPNIRIRSTDGEWIKKAIVKTVDITDYGVRVALNVERKINPLDLEPIGKRTKNRVSFIAQHVIFDCTRVHSEIDGRHSDEFEVEMEFRNTPDTLKVFRQELDGFISLLQGGSKHVIPYSGINVPSRVQLMKEFNRIFDPDRKFEFWFDNSYPKPRDLNRDDIPKLGQYAVTDKADGVRRWLYLSRQSSGAYLMNINSNHELIKRVNTVRYESPLASTLLEGEYLHSHDHFLIFDILAFDGKDVREQPFTERLKHMRVVAEGLKNENVSLKQFRSGDGMLKWAFEHLEDLHYVSKGKRHSYDNDGLIFVPLNEEYMPTEDILKWKPRELLTIDFQLMGNDGTYKLLNIESGKRLQFKGIKSNPNGGVFKAEKDQTLDGIPFANGMIVEFAWRDKWVPVRIRHDKTVPNKVSVAKDVWRHIHRPITKDMLMGMSAESESEEEEEADGTENQNMRKMRRYHNDVKRMVIDSIDKNTTVIDIGAGKGGDIQKYKRRGISVIAIEPNPENIAEMQKRLIGQDYSSSYTIIEGKAEDPDIVEEIKCTKDTNTVTSFFSLTFFFENEEKLDALVNLLDRLNNKCGLPMRFIGTTLDGRKLHDFMAGHTSIVSKDLYTIRRLYDYKPNDEIGVGKEITFQIHGAATIDYEQTEYLVDFNLLKRKLSNIGFTLEWKQGFSPPAYLSKSVVKLSELNVAFSFVAKPKRVHTFARMPVLRKNANRGYRNVDHFLPPFCSYVRTGSSGDGSCFIHSILRAIDEEAYVEQGSKLAYELRRYLASKFTFDDLKKIHNGLYIVSEFAEKMKTTLQPFIDANILTEARLTEIYNNQFETVADLKRILIKELSFIPQDQLEILMARTLISVLKDHQTHLKEPSEWLGIDDIPYIGEQLDIDIYIINATFGKPVDVCNDVKRTRKSVIVLWLNNSHFETIGIFNPNAEHPEETIEYTFDPDHPMIKELYSMMCEEEP